MDKPKPVAAGDSKPKIGKKSFFQGDKGQNLFIMISRLPGAELIIESVDRMNDKAVSNDNLQALDKNWPVDDFDALMEEHAQDKTAVWEKAEAYFIKLGEKPKFQLRIKVWLFKMNFDKNMKDLLFQQTTMLNAFGKIRENPKLKKLFGAILRFGNCLNAGNKSRGQADGYDLGDLKSTMTLKDAAGRSILMILCQYLYEDDNEFIKFKEDFKDVYDSIKLSTEDLQKKTDNLKNENTKTKNLFSQIDKSDEQLMELKYGKEMKKFLTTTDEKIAEAEKNMKLVVETYTGVCDLLMIKKVDEIRAKSEKFMEFFATFFNDVQKSMPKIEEPKKAKPGAAGKKAVRSAMQMNMMAELKQKQAAQSSKN